jgi:two-component system KDP operon response regulator KdpE
LSPEVIVLNGSSPVIDWLSAVRQFRASTQAVIIVVAEEYDEGDLIEAVEAGADDYLQVPLQRILFVARIRSTIRRAHGWRAEAQPSACGGLHDRYEASVNGSSLHLTPTEFQILFQLTQQSGTITRSEELFRTVWHDDSRACAPTLRKYIQQLRRKLAECPECKAAIVTVPGVGYRLVSEEDPSAGRLAVS